MRGNEVLVLKSWRLLKQEIGNGILSLSPLVIILNVTQLVMTKNHYWEHLHKMLLSLKKTMWRWHCSVTPVIVQSFTTCNVVK